MKKFGKKEPPAAPVTMTAQETSDDLDEKLEALDLGHKPVRGVVSSGVMGVDFLTYLPGIPRGCVIDLFGEEGLGKTTLALTLVAERLLHKEPCAYIDMEHRLNQALIDIVVPINSDLLRIQHPKDGESAIKEIMHLADAGQHKMIVLDSVAALVPEDAMNLNEEASNSPAKIARLMSESLRALATLAYKHDTILLFINQMRSRPMMMGPSRAPTGGSALKFYASLRLEIMRDMPIRQGEKVIGQRVKLQAVKNSFGPPNFYTALSVVYGEGVDKVRDLIDLGIELGVITKSSSWFEYKDLKANGEIALSAKIMDGYFRSLRDDVKAAWDERRAKLEAEKLKRKEAMLQMMISLEAEDQAVIDGKASVNKEG